MSKNSAAINGEEHDDQNASVSENLKLPDTSPENEDGIEMVRGRARSALKKSLEIPVLSKLASTGKEMLPYRGTVVFRGTTSDIAGYWNRSGDEKSGFADTDEVFWFPIGDYTVCRYGEKNKAGIYSFAFLPRYFKTENYGPEMWRKLREVYEGLPERRPANGQYIIVTEPAITVPDERENVFAMVQPGRTKKGKVVLADHPYDIYPRRKLG
jgi:hypothetical protein